MKSFTKVIAIVCLMSFVTIQAQAQAQAQEEKKLVSGNSFNVMIPQGDLSNTYEHGFGMYANFDYNFNKFLAARFDFGWNDLSGDETSYVDPDGTIHVNHPNMSVWEFTGGLRAKVSIFYVEARGGYFTGLKSWGYVPAAGIRIGKFDIQGNYTIAGDNQWASARVAYYWGK